MDKKRHTIFLSERAWNTVEENYLQDNCGTRNEFIEKAIHFYAGYLKCLDASDYLPRVVSDVISGTLSQTKKKIGRLLFKLSVEHNITNHLIASDSDIDVSLYEKLRGRSVREVMQTQGEINLCDNIRFQKEV